MKKLAMLFMSATILTACSTNADENVEFKANENHLENIVFQGLDQNGDSLSFANGQLTIVIDEVFNAIKPDVDVEELAGKEQSEEIIVLTKISTKDDTYLIEGKGEFKMELKRDLI